MKIKILKKEKTLLKKNDIMKLLPGKTIIVRKTSRGIEEKQLGNLLVKTEVSTRPLFSLTNNLIWGDAFSEEFEFEEVEAEVVIKY